MLLFYGGCAGCIKEVGCVLGYGRVICLGCM